MVCKERCNVVSVILCVVFRFEWTTIRFESLSNPMHKEDLSYHNPNG